MRILIVDDDRALADILKDHCSARGHDVTCVGGAADFLPVFDARDPDLVLLDVRLGDGNGLDLLEQLRERRCETPVAVMTGYDPLASASFAAARGAEYFLRKPFGIDEFDRVLDEVRRHARGQPVPPGKPATPLDAAIAFSGTSRAMTEVCRQIGLAARTGVTTLIEGESGVGKELAARAIHTLGGAGRPFVTVDCTTIVETLFESELFGHEKGAFTDAHTLRRGKAEAAHGGVLFLDEIAELTPRMQSKLLRLLQTRSFERVGGNAPIHAAFQLVAATNRDLEAMSRAGAFRSDLLYRLDVHRVRIPPLRERPEDVPPLAAALVRHAALRLRMPLPEIAAEAVALLVAHDWPGNVRELENVVTRLVLRAQGGSLGPKEVSAVLGRVRRDPPRRTLDQVECEAIRAALDYADWNYGKACELLNISRPTLRRKIARYRLRPPE